MKRLLADENYPHPGIRKLRASGFDVASIREEARGILDTEVMIRARAQDRVLITFDSDFGDLIYRDGHSPPPGVVFFRTRPSYPEEPADLLLRAIEVTELDLVGKFTVIHRDHIRQRDLPRAT